MSRFDLAELESTIDAAFDDRDSINTGTRGQTRDAVDEALNLLDHGDVRVAEKGQDGNWKVNQWLKKAVLLSFRLNPMDVIKGGPGDAQTHGGNLDATIIQYFHRGSKPLPLLTQKTGRREMTVEPDGKDMPAFQPHRRLGRPDLQTRHSLFHQKGRNPPMPGTGIGFCIDHDELGMGSI